jgi:hypothetical protein
MSVEPLLVVIFVGIITYRLLFDVENFSKTVGGLNLPLVLILFILLFKKTIVEKFQSMTELKYQDTSAKFQQREVQAQEDVASREFAKILGQNSEKILDRTEIENVMRMAAAWGFNMAKIGFRSTPMPIVDWNGSAPTIKFGQSQILSPANENEKAFIVSKILETQEAIDSLSVFDRSGAINGLIPSKQSVLMKKLMRLYANLRMVDPNSPFLPKE